MKREFLLLAVVLLSGCGSINTVLREDDYAQRELTDLKTRCETIPRVYSGVAYDFCSLNAEYKYGTDTSGPLLAGALLDGVLSGALDTLALPYTLYHQANEGSMTIRRQTWTPEAKR